MSTITTIEQKKDSNGGYWKQTKEPQVILLLLLPLFFIYAVGILTTGGIRNGVDLVTDFLRGTIFRGNDLLYAITMMGTLAVMISYLAKMKERRIFNPKIYLGIIIEGAVYGNLLGLVVFRFMAAIGIYSLAAGTPSCGVWCNFIMSIGAGLWEEIFFRLLLIGLPVLILGRLFPARKRLLVVVIVLVSSLVFSAIHYVGPLADNFTLYSFIFRFICGIIFAVIYYLRGLAVAVYTHAAYDIMVLIF